MGLLQYGVPSLGFYYVLDMNLGPGDRTGNESRKVSAFMSLTARGEKARLWSQTNLSCKILVPPFSQLDDLQGVI